MSLKKVKEKNDFIVIARHLKEDKFDMSAF